MALNGIDLSSYQGSLNLDNVTYDFAAIKATEGKGYVNPYCDTHYQEAKAAGKKRLVYHFYDFSVDAATQADYFVDNCAGYIRDAIFALDWEGPNVDRVGDALRFLQRVEERIGYKPAIYMSEYVENHYDWTPVVDGDYGLWAAKYADYEIDNNYNMSGAGTEPHITRWPFYFMWQWTSKGRLNGYAGDLDCDIFYGDAHTWDLYAGYQEPSPTEAPVPPAENPEPTQPTQETTTPPVVTEPTPPAETPPKISDDTPLPPITEPSAPAANPSWWSIIVAVIVAIYNRLRSTQL